MDNIKKLADDFYRCRYFFTLSEYFNKHNINDENIKREIKIELSEIQKKEAQQIQLIDTLLKGCKAFKFSQLSNRNNYMVYSPSCINKSSMRLTFFYNGEPSSHIERSTITDIKSEIKQYINRYNFLEMAIGKLV